MLLTGTAAPLDGLGSADASPADHRADTTHPGFDAERAARLIHESVNEIRTQKGRATLAYADSLTPLARVHSQDMARRDFLAHVNPDGQGVNDRARKIGLDCTKSVDASRTAHGFGENLFSGTIYRGYREIMEPGQPTRREYDWHTESSFARLVVQGWMDSRGHRKNLLDPQYDAEALFVALDGTKAYVTQIFC
jgi:uncharacterized protein YkwD